MIQTFSVVAMVFAFSAHAASSLESAKLTLLGQALSNAKIQKTLTKDGLELCAVHFVEADDAGTEPLYLVTMCKYDPKVPNWVSKCFSIDFDTDSPQVGASLSEAECFETQ